MASLTRSCFCIQSNNSMRTEINSWLTNIQAGYVRHRLWEPGQLEVHSICSVLAGQSQVSDSTSLSLCVICRMGWITPALCVQGKNQYVQCWMLKVYLILFTGLMIFVMTLKKLVSHKSQATINSPVSEKFLLRSEVQYCYLNDCSSRTAYALCSLTCKRYSWVLKPLWNFPHDLLHFRA